MSLERANLFGFDFISSTDYDNLLWDLENGVHLEEEDLPILITPNVDQIVKYHKRENSNLRHQMTRAKYILPDGQPLVWLSKFKANKLRARLTGSDFFSLLWKHIISSAKRTSFVLSSKDVAAALKSEYSRISHFVPTFYSVSNPQEHAIIVDAVFTMVKENQSQYLIIGLGFPKQEYLALSLLERCKDEDVKPPLMFLLGASMEFYTRVKKRAPKIYQKMGLEFLHRIISEPKRMVKRYLYDDLAFLPLAFKELISARSKK